MLSKRYEIQFFKRFSAAFEILEIWYINLFSHFTFYMYNFCRF